MRVRLRDAYPDPAAFYAERYPTGYQHRIWPDHVERVEAAVQFALTAGAAIGAGMVADLSAGDGEIPRRIVDRTPRIAGQEPPALWLSDLLRIEGKNDDGGPLEQTVQRMPYADLLVCSETLEHLDDPGGFLYVARGRVAKLLVTTPEGETDPEQNPEHYWGWDSDGVMDLLIATGWRPYHHQLFTPSCGPYTFQMWMCR